MVRRWLGVLSVAFALLACPSVAFAEEVSPLDSFANGFGTLVGNPEVSENDGYDAMRDYEPELREVELRAVEEEDTTQSAIERVGNRFNRVNWGDSTNVTLINATRLFLGGGTSVVSPVALYLPLAAGLVFMWWGLRKSLKIIMDAWRKGRASL